MAGYHIHEGAGAADVTRAQRLRHRCFRGGEGVEADAFDAAATHVLIEDAQGLAATFRVFAHPGAPQAARGYTGGFYDLAPLSAQSGPLIELGRFCIRPDLSDPQLPRLAFGWLTALVDRLGAAMLFGCTSFPGTDPAAHAGALARLHAHLGPPGLRPAPRPAQRSVDLTPGPAPAPLPPLLRSYLALGGWVGERAVIDPSFGTIHVFTGLVIADVPPARARALRAIAAASTAP
ncbi:MAG: GNAT family N-acetyltransferase [Paracoccaceae bacterium]